MSTDQPEICGALLWGDFDPEWVDAMGFAHTLPCPLPPGHELPHRIVYADDPATTTHDEEATDA